MPSSWKPSKLLTRQAAHSDGRPQESQVKITLVPSAVGGHGQALLQYLTSYLINDTVAIDAGSLGVFKTPADQARIRHVLLSHTHIDHIGSLPVLVENAYEGKRDCMTIHGSEAVLDCLRRDVFNDRVWPDFISMSSREAPFLRLATLEAGRPLELEGLRITPVAVNHVVPTLGFIVEDQAAGVVISSDTGPTDELWRRANAVANLKAVFLEATFPESMAQLATVAKHLTPSMFAGEVRKLKRPVPVIAVHIKARFYDQMVDELQALGLPNLEIGRAGKSYTF
jgi:ribonuclease BN (tRNA processing enzyme)